MDEYNILVLGGIILMAEELIENQEEQTEENIPKRRSKWKRNKDIIDYPKVLKELEDKYSGKDDILGMNSLTFPEYMSSSRAIMFANHCKQRVNLINTEIPRMFTNCENLVGDNSSSKYTTEKDFEVYGKVSKFDFMPEHIYYMFTYNEAEDKYEMIIKKISEELTENHGYSYNNEVIDSLNVGDKVSKGTTLFKSTGYDENDCYGFGVNALTVHVIDNNTIEDGIEISESLAKKLISNEEERIVIPINDNDYLCNIYGDENTYKGFPDIGEGINDHVVIALRRVINDQILYDMKKSNLMKLAPMDDTVYYSQGGKIVDIDIFCNKSIEDIPETEMNFQILRYLRNQERFYSELHEMCKEIVQSGSSYSDDIGFWYRRSRDMLDSNYEFSDGKNTFNNIIVEFSVEREVGVSVGSKLTGRFGNKGVISIIVKDDKDMPYTEDGRRIEVKMNGLGPCNRLITGPLYETALNAASNDICMYARGLKTYKEKFNLLDRYLSHFNDRKWGDGFREHFKSLSKEEQKETIDNIIENFELYIHTPPMWGESLFNKLDNIHKEFAGIVKGRVQCYIDKWGRKIPIMNKLLVGEQYIMKLKQSSKKGFSARSMGFINTKGLPDKTNRLKTNLQLYSTIPVKWGIDESLNISSGVSPRDVAEFHLLHRNSVLGRREMSKLATEDILDFEEFELKSTYKNRNMEILNALLKCTGKQIVFPGDMVYISKKDDMIETFLYEDGFYLLTEEEMTEAIIDKYYRDKFTKITFVGSDEERELEFQKYKRHELMKLDKTHDYVYHTDDDII